MALNALLWLLISANMALIVWGFISRQRLYRFTVMFAASFAGFAIPQLIGISNETGKIALAVPLPEGALDLLCLVSMLCVVAVWLGDNRGVYHPGSSPLLPLDAYDVNWLIRFAVLLNVVGVVISQVIVRFVLGDEYMSKLGNQWTGPITILYFFQYMQKYGFALAVLLYLRLRSPVCLFCILFNIVTQLISFSYLARRGGMADMLFTVILGLYFGRRYIMPAWMLGLMFVVGSLLSNSIGEFRGNLEMTFSEKLERADVWGQFQDTLNNGGYELANAAMAIAAADAESEYDYGLVHWNQFVHAYFPGQIFGHDLKKAIQYPIRNLPFEIYGYRAPIGTTLTGMSDSFCSFWYIGCLKFYLIGYVMGRWWNRANRGDLRAQLAYMSLMSCALHTISHGTYWLFNNYLHMVIFAYPCLYLAQLRGGKPLPKLAKRKPVLAIDGAGHWA